MYLDCILASFKVHKLMLKLSSTTPLEGLNTSEPYARGRDLSTTCFTGFTKYPAFHKWSTPRQMIYPFVRLSFCLQGKHIKNVVSHLLGIDRTKAAEFVELHDQVEVTHAPISFLLERGTDPLASDS
jgi:hypothetical protein